MGSWRHHALQDNTNLRHFRFSNIHRLEQYSSLSTCHQRWSEAFDSRTDRTEDLKNDSCGLSSLVIGVDGWVQGNSWPAAIDLPPTWATRKRPRKRPRGPRCKQAEMQTKRDTPKGVHKPSVNETEQNRAFLSMVNSIYQGTHDFCKANVVTSLGHQVGRRVFWEGPKLFKLCPMVLNYVQHIFPGGGEKNVGGSSPPVQCALPSYGPGCNSSKLKVANLYIHIR